MTTEADILALIQQIQQKQDDILASLYRGQRSGFNQVIESQTSLATDVGAVNTNVSSVTTTVGDVSTTVGSIAAGLGTFTPLLITPMAANSIGLGVAASGSATPASGTILASNEGLFVPFALSQPVTVTGAFSFNGASAAGNVDVGVYDADYNLLASSGAVAQTTGRQALSLASTSLPIGTYYIGLSISNGTATFMRFVTTGVAYWGNLGVLSQSAVHPLPSSASPSTSSSTVMPVFGVTIEL